MCAELGVGSDSIEYIAPCSPLQQGIVSRALTDTRGLYFNQIELRLQEEVSLDGMREAWDELVALEPILRSVPWRSYESHDSRCI